MFRQPPVIHFVPEKDTCHCGDQLGVMKTRKKTVLCLTGPFIAHETVYKCPSCFQIFVSDALLLLVPARCNVAYDVLVFVGQALFQRYRTIEEVRIELLVTHNLRISASEVGYLGRKFIMYLAIGHRLATPRIRENMKRQGCKKKIIPINDNVSESIRE